MIKENSDLIKRIKDEIEKDPDNVGYKGLSPKEISIIINSPIKRIVELEVCGEAPIFRIINGIDGIDNTISEDDIMEALK